MKNNIKAIYLIGFLFSIPLALTSYINSSFLETYINQNYIGILYIIGSILTIWAMLKTPKILTRFGNRNTTIALSIWAMLSFLLLAYSNNKTIIVLSFISYFLTTSFIVACLDIFIEDFSKSSSVGKLRGMYLMTINLAWIISQTISGSIIERSSYSGIYLFSAGFMILVTIVLILLLKEYEDPKYTKVPILKTLKVFIKNKDISKIYFVNLILKFFFAWMVIYTPIYLHQYLKFDWGKIGFIFTIMLIPFVLVDYPLGKLSDKIGEKKMLIAGFVITTLFTLVIPFIKNNEFIIWAIVLFGTRLGAATIEVMSESYFFKKVGEKNADEISFFRSTQPFSYIISSALAIPVLILVPSFEYLFLVLTAILLIGLLISFRLKDIK